MNLLPKAADEFRNPDYWDQFFDKVGADAFEWFVSNLFFTSNKNIFLILGIQILSI